MNIEPLEMFAGEDRTFTLHARSTANLPVSLTGKTVQWFMGPRYHCEHASVFTKTGTVTDADAGTFTVSVAAADTANIEGDYEHMAKATTISGGAVAVIVAGRFRVRPVLVP